MFKVLLYIDQKRRDEYGVMRLRERLTQEKNIHVKVSGKLDFLFTVQCWKPHIIVYGKTDGYHGDWLRCIHHAKVLSLNTEQGFDREEIIYTNFISGHASERSPANDRVDYFFLFSQRMKDVLEKWLPKERLVVTGSPRVIQKKPETTARVVRKPLTIGIALGANLGGSSEILNYFEKYKNKTNFSDYNNIEGFFAYHTLEKVWLDFVVKQLSRDYKLIVRPRFCDARQFSDAQANIVYDWSADLTFLAKHSDLVITGQSTLGIEMMMTGVPVISVTRMINPGFQFEKLLQRNYVKPLWQPETYDEFIALINQRKDNSLLLSPDVEQYLDVVKANFYGGNEEDLSIEKVVKTILSLNVKREASVDTVQYKTYFGKTKVWFILRVLNVIKHDVIYSFLMKYFRYKVKGFNKKNRNYSIFIDA